MPRPRSKGLLYFPLDVDFFSDKDIKILKARYGTDGIVVYLYLLCEIYKNGYYMRWNDDYKFIVADDLHLADGLIEQVMTFLVSRSLLYEVAESTLAAPDETNLGGRSLPDGSTLAGSDTIITSPGIQRRYQAAIKERGRKTPIEVGDFWLLDEKETEPYIKVTHNADNSGKNADNSGKNADNSGKNGIKKSKVKESKVYKRESIYNLLSGPTEAPAPSALFPAPTIEQVDAYCKENGLGVNAAAFVSYYNANGWVQGSGKPIIDWRAQANLWALRDAEKKEKADKHRKEPDAKSFHNFRGREYDFAELERKLCGGGPDSG